MPDVTIRNTSPLAAITVEHVGPYDEISEAFNTLFAELSSRGLLDQEYRTIAIFYDDPATVPAANLLSRAGLVFTRDVDVERPLERTEVAGGDYAVVRHEGSYQNLKATYDWFYGEWLPASGRSAKSAPSLEEYLNDAETTAPADLLTDIFVPLA